MNASVPSPITGGPTALVRKIRSDYIIGLYKDYDVSRFFKDIPEISVLECGDTGYRFFYPYSIAGDDAYYRYLSKGENYYVPWKLEHSIALEHMDQNDKVLEIGCANGDFLAGARQKKGIVAEGTELNKEALEKARQKGLTVYGEGLDALLRDRSGHYDAVCSFQVLEHISAVRPFIEDSISLLKKGGALIIGVPNNDTFIRETRDAFLNMPPHHMGLWNEPSLRKMGAFFGLDAVGIYFEPLQKYHYRYYYQVVFGDRLGFFGKTGLVGFIGKVLNKALYECFGRFIIMARAKKIRGHTIVAVFRKR